MEENVKNAFDKVIKAIIDDKSLYDLYPRTNFKNKELTVDGICDLACNHLLDDHPELFGLTKKEGLIVREYINNNKNYSKEILEEFKEYF